MTDIEEMGPIDFAVIEWPGRQPDGTALPHLVELVDKGIIRLLDMTFIAKGEDGSVVTLEVSDLGDEFEVFMGVSSGMLDESDLDEAAGALEAGRSAAVLVWENRWAAPFATALRKNGAQLVASGRLPVQAVLAALESETASV